MRMIASACLSSTRKKVESRDNSGSKILSMRFLAKKRENLSKSLQKIIPEKGVPAGYVNNFVNAMKITRRYKTLAEKLFTCIKNLKIIF